MLTHIVLHIFLTARPTNFKLCIAYGWRTTTRISHRRHDLKGQGCNVTWSVCAVLAHCCTCVNGSGPRGGHTVSAESGGHTSCLNLCCSARMHAVCICIGCMNASIEWITLHTRRGQEFKCLMCFLRTFWPTENKNEIVNVIKTTMFSGYHSQSLIGWNH